MGVIALGLGGNSGKGGDVIASPRVGQQVQIWYRKDRAPHMPYHGKLGTVVISGRGKPRNHLVNIDGTDVVVPCGNLRRPE